MRGAQLVQVHPLARRAWPWLPPRAPAGAVFIGPTGQVLRVAGDSTVGEVVQGSRPHGGAASDPCNARGSAWSAATPPHRPRAA